MRNVQEFVNLVMTAHAQEAQRMLWQMAQPLFDAHPDLTSFAWAQFTDIGPFGGGFHADTELELLYVNDDINHDDTHTWKVKPGAVKDEFGRFRWEDHEAIDTEHAHLRPAIQAVADFLAPFDEGMLYRAFGDQAKVIVTRDGVKVEPFLDHE